MFQFTLDSISACITRECERRRTKRIASSWILISMFIQVLVAFQYELVNDVCQEALEEFLVQNSLISRLSLLLDWFFGAIQQEIALENIPTALLDEFIELLLVIGLNSFNSKLEKKRFEDFACQKLDNWLFNRVIGNSRWNSSFFKALMTFLLSNSLFQEKEEQFPLVSSCLHLLSLVKERPEGIGKEEFFAQSSFHPNFRTEANYNVIKRCLATHL
jgi:hypothetical protein